MRYILSGGVVVTMDDKNSVFDPGVVVIEPPYIVHVAAEGSWKACDGDQAIDCRGSVVMPGLINTHSHACMALFRGMGGLMRPSDLISAGYLLPLQRAALPDDYYWGALLGGLEMLRNGIVCTADRFAHMDLIADAFERLGMRAVVCHTLRDLPGPPEWEQALALIDRWGTSPERRIHAGIGPHAPDTCSEDLLRRTRRVASETGARIFIHCAQSSCEIDIVRARGYQSSIHYLAATDLLGPDLVLAHCIYVDENDIYLLRDSGAWVSHCPVSNAMLEGRLPPVPAMLYRGVRVALGTDWAVTNGNMDLFDEMKCCSIVHKVLTNDPTVLGPERVLRMATIDAARALGLDGLTGSLEPGKRGDVIVVDVNDPHLQPHQNLEGVLVFSAKGLDVRHVWVDGEWLIRERRHVTVDIDEVLEQVARIWSRYRRMVAINCT